MAAAPQDDPDGAPGNPVRDAGAATTAPDPDGDVRAGVDPDDVGDIGRGAAERLAFFSDAVVAIAITLLAIELPVPRGETNAEFFTSVREESFAYLTFLVSFLVIAIYWMAHHRVFRYVARVDQRLVVLNLAWLLLIVLTPFLTEVVREGDNLTIARFGTYALAQALILGVFALIMARLERDRMYVPGTPAGLTHHGWLGPVFTSAAFLVSIPLFAVIEGWAFAVWAIVPMILGRISDRLGWTLPRHAADRARSG